MDENEMTEGAKRIHDEIMAEVWTEWISSYFGESVRMVELPQVPEVTL